MRKKFNIMSHLPSNTYLLEMETTFTLYFPINIVFD